MALFSIQSAAQTVLRNFPEKALRGLMVVRAAPEISMNGRMDRLSPGARVRGPNNMLISPSTLMGQEVTVNFLRDAGGNVHEVWILTAEELAMGKEQARKGLNTRNYSFASDGDAVTVDDGKTPYNKLPAYKSQ